MSQTETSTGIEAALLRLRGEVERELRAYPYPITACDVNFKLLAEQREHLRVALFGLAGRDGLTPQDAAEAVSALLATPLAAKPEVRRALQRLAGTLAVGAQD